MGKEYSAHYLKKELYEKVRNAFLIYNEGNPERQNAAYSSKKSESNPLLEKLRIDLAEVLGKNAPQYSVYNLKDILLDKNKLRFEEDRITFLELFCTRVAEIAQQRKEGEPEKEPPLTKGENSKKPARSKKRRIAMVIVITLTAVATLLVAINWKDWFAKPKTEQNFISVDPLENNMGFSYFHNQTFIQDTLQTNIVDEVDYQEFRVKVHVKNIGQRTMNVKFRMKFDEAGTAESTKIKTYLYSSVFGEIEDVVTLDNLPDKWALHLVTVKPYSSDIELWDSYTKLDPFDISGRGRSILSLLGGEQYVLCVFRVHNATTFKRTDYIRPYFDRDPLNIGGSFLNFDDNDKKDILIADIPNPGDKKAFTATIHIKSNNKSSIHGVMPKVNFSEEGKKKYVHISAQLTGLYMGTNTISRIRITELPARWSLKLDSLRVQGRDSCRVNPMLADKSEQVERIKKGTLNLGTIFGKDNKVVPNCDYFRVQLHFTLKNELEN